MNIYENERIDYVNDNLSLIQKTDGLTFGTDALLLAGYLCGKFKRGAELGGGSGIISMLMLTRDKIELCDCYEIQTEYAELIRRNAELNHLAERLHTVKADVREYKGSGEYDLVFSNPPYMKATSGALNQKDAKTIARHEMNGDIGEFILSAKRMLRYGGTLLMVYRPDRTCDLVYEMRKNGIEPKRMTFVHAYTDSEPSMLLVEGRSGGKSGMQITKPLILYKDRAHREYTEDVNYIMENGSFPSEYKR